MILGSEVLFFTKLNSLENTTNVISICIHRACFQNNSDSPLFIEVDDEQAVDCEQLKARGWLQRSNSNIIIIFYCHMSWGP